MTRRATPARVAIEQPYRERHEASQRCPTCGAGRGDRIAGRPTTLLALLRWSTREYSMETPGLQHYITDMDPMGDPEMRPAPKQWLGLALGRQTRDGESDNWRALACRTDKDGNYVTPMRCAIERTRDGEREFVKRLALGVGSPEEVSATFGVPKWADNIIVYGVLQRLWDRYRERPLPQRKWTELSASQQAAIEDGERGAA